MKITYDPEVDALYIEIRIGDFDHNTKLDTNTIVNYDKEGNVLGIELLFVKERNPTFLERINFKNILSV